MAEEMTPGIREWRRLYESAVRIKEMSPWEWMTETDVFGVRSPETGELGFVSVMGLLGEHYAVSLYLGSEGIHGFLDLQEMGPFADPGGPDPGPPNPGVVRRSRGAGQERPRGHKGPGLEVQGAKRLADVPELPPISPPVVFGGRRGPFSIVRA
jgi:hypothetical protein